MLCADRYAPGSSSRAFLCALMTRMEQLEISPSRSTLRHIRTVAATVNAEDFVTPRRPPWKRVQARIDVRLKERRKRKTLAIGGLLAIGVIALAGAGAK